MSAETRRRIETLRDRYPHPRSAILPSLWAVQEEVGHLSPAAMAEVAAVLAVAPSEVQAVSTFYSMYFQRPAGRHHVLVCVNAACALRGADDVAAYMERKLGVASTGTTADGMWTWQATIECLGGCGGAPMMQVDSHTYEGLSPDRIDAIMERIAAQPDHRRAAATAPAAPAARAAATAAAAPGVPAPPTEGPPSFSAPDVEGPSAGFTEQLAPGAVEGPEQAPKHAAEAEEQVRQRRRGRRGGRRGGR